LFLLELRGSFALKPQLGVASYTGNGPSSQYDGFEHGSVCHMTKANFNATSLDDTGLCLGRPAVT
jgi:hypothetical protein